MKKALSPLTLLFLVPFVTISCTQGPVTGIVYHDADRSSRSEFDQTLTPSDIRLEGVELSLMDGQGEQQATTGSDGVFSFQEVEPGTYLIDVGVSPLLECTSHNRPVRLPAAIREGAVHVVAVGDSVSITGSDVPFPEHLVSRLSQIAPTTLNNLAVDGSTSWQWLPGSQEGYFEERLLPALEDADLLTITLGANDLYFYISDGPPYDPIKIIEKILQHPEYLLNLVPNVTGFLEAVLALSPQCDIVYVIYWNAANSEIMRGILGGFQPLASIMVEAALTLLRDSLKDLEGILFSDMMSALGNTLLDPYLLDEVHPNDAGHLLYADILFHSIGGVFLEEGTPQNRNFGFFDPDLVP